MPSPKFFMSVVSAADDTESLEKKLRHMPSILSKPNDVPLLLQEARKKLSLSLDIYVLYVMVPNLSPMCYAMDKILTEMPKA